MAPKRNFSSFLLDERPEKNGHQIRKEDSPFWKAGEYAGKMQHEGRNAKKYSDSKQSFSLSI